MGVGERKAAAIEPALLLAAPNPFNSSTTITYSLEKAAMVKIHILNTMGQVVRTFSANHQSTGKYSFRWDGTNYKNDFVASGVYFLRLQIGEESRTTKLLLVR